MIRRKSGNGSSAETLSAPIDPLNVLSLHSNPNLIVLVSSWQISRSSHDGKRLLSNPWLLMSCWAHIFFIWLHWWSSTSSDDCRKVWHHSEVARGISGWTIRAFLGCLDGCRGRIYRRHLISINFFFLVMNLVHQVCTCTWTCCTRTYRCRCRCSKLKNRTKPWTVYTYVYASMQSCGCKVHCCFNEIWAIMVY